MGSLNLLFTPFKMKAEPVVTMSNKLKLLTVEADRTRKGIIGAQVCCCMLECAQLSYP